MIPLKQSTATILKAEFYDATDGVTPETALSIAQADIQISKNGGTYAQTSDASPTTTHDAGGSYPIPLTATDTNTLGRIRVKVVKTGALPWFAEYIVVPANVYDSLVSGSDLLQVDVDQIDGDATAAQLTALSGGTGETNTAQAGATGSVTLAAGASATDDAYNNWIVTIVSGTGSGQSRYCTDYNGTTKVASVSPDWGTAPDATSVYLLTLLPPGVTLTAALQKVDVVAFGGVTATTASGRPEVNVTHVGGSAEGLARTTQLTTVEGKVDSVQADIVTLDTVADAVKAVTDLLPDSGALTTLITHLTDIKGGAFAGGTHDLVSLRARGDAAWVTGSGGAPPQLLADTTIATLTSQTVFTLTAGAPDDDAYNGFLVVVEDQATSTQKCVGVIQDYVGSSKQVTLVSDPGIFTMAVGDIVKVVAAGAGAFLTAPLASYNDAGSVGERLNFLPSQAVASERAAVADAILGRNIAGGSDGGRTVTSALRAIRNRVATSVNTLTVYEEDDSTIAWSAAITTEAGDPITDLDPS